MTQGARLTEELATRPRSPWSTLTRPPARFTLEATRRPFAFAKRAGRWCRWNDASRSSRSCSSSGPWRPVTGVSCGRFISCRLRGT